MMSSILRHANVTAQAILVKQVDHYPPPQPEEAAHAFDEEAVHHPPPPVVLLLPQEANVSQPHTQAQDDDVCPS